MKLHCPDCHQPTPAEHVELFEGLADCSSCNKRYPFENLFRSRRTVAPRPHVDRPKQFQEIRSEERLKIAWPCLQRAQIVSFSVFAVIWNASLIFWYIRALNGRDDSFTVVVMLLFPLIHVAAGIGMSYVCLAYLTGRTELSVSRTSLHTRHLPLPLPWLRHAYQRDEIAQIFCRQRRRFRRSSNAVMYELCIWLKNGFEVLVDVFPEYQQAAYLEQEIEEHLQLEDRPVRGEIR